VSSRSKSSHRLAAGFWLAAFSLFSVTALATAPSPLYGLYQQRDGLSLLAVTVIYAGYAVGIVLSLFLAGHLSDWYGRRVVLFPALVVAAASAVVFVLWQSFAGLLAARILTGLSLGAAVATVTAYLLDLDTALRPDRPSLRGLLVGIVANIGGLAFGALVSGLLAQYEPHPLILPYLVPLGALSIAAAGVLVGPETRPAASPKPRYHPQRIVVPPEARAPYYAALPYAPDLRPRTPPCARWRAPARRRAHGGAFRRRSRSAPLTGLRLRLLDERAGGESAGAC
jgi:MFS family permease